MRASVVYALLGLVPSVLGQATHPVMVGVKGSFYDPPTNSAEEGDIIQFIFGGVFHGVTQSTLENPCIPLPGGFSSGLQGTGGNQTTNVPVWNLIVTNTSAPIWFFCQATQPENHCAQGMVGAINAPPAMYANFTSRAKAFVPLPTPPPIVTVLSGIGASATAAPALTGTLSAPASTITPPPPDSTSFTPPAQTSAAPTNVPSSTSKSGVDAAVIGGAVGGGAALLVIGILLYLLLRKKSTPSVTYVETSERVPYHASKPGWSSPEPDIPSLRNKPSSSAFDTSGREIHRQGSRNALKTSAIRRNASYAASDGSSNAPLMSSERDRANSQLRYENSRADILSLTMADALSSHPYAHTFTPMPVESVPEQPEPLRERDPVLDRGPDVDVHELAKEVAALLGPQNPLPQPPLPPSLPPTGHPGQQPLSAMPSLRVPHARAPRHLPNPRNLNFGQGVRSPEPDSSLPQYER